VRRRECRPHAEHCLSPCSSPSAVKEKAILEPSSNLTDQTATAVISDGGAVTSGRPAASGFRARIKTLSSSGRAATAIREGTWSISGYVATQAFRTVGTLILARLFLEPETFGVFGLVAVFLAGLSMFSELGIVANVVQHVRGDDARFLNTAFTIQAARGLGIWAIGLIAAYPLSLFYDQPQLLSLLAVAGVAELIRGLTSTSAWTLTRHVRLRNITLLTVAAEAVSFAVVLMWAIYSPSAWALVARSLASAVVLTVGSHFIAQPRVTFGWDTSAARDILHFGGWISISTAAYFLGGQSERLIMGKFVTPAELGCFSLALMISSVPSAGIGQLVNQIFLPMMSQTVRTSRAQTVRDFLRSRHLFFGTALFAGIGFFACGKLVATLLLPPAYHMVGWMLQALGIRVALDLFTAPVSSLMLAYGRSKYAAAGNTLRLILMVCGIWAAFAYFGIREAIIVLLVAQVLSYGPLILGLRKVLPQVWRTELRWYAFFLALLGVAAMVPWPAA